jgi:recombination protein RecT
MAPKNQIQKTDPVNQLAKLIASKKDAFALVAGKHFSPDRLIKLAQGALARNPKIADCVPASVLVCLMRCAELDLEPDSALPQKRMWLVPRWNKNLGGMELTYVIDYRAKIQAARETGLLKSIVGKEVRERDQFTLHYSADGDSITKFEHTPEVFGERGNVIGYYAVARLDGGEVQIATMSKKEAEVFRDRHAPKKKDGTAAFSPWKTDFDAMAVKSTLNKLWNLLPAGKTAEARRFMDVVREEQAIEVGTPTQNTAPDLGLGVLPQTTDREVEEALGAVPHDDIPFDSAEEEALRKAQELADSASEPPEPGSEG